MNAIRMPNGDVWTREKFKARDGFSIDDCMSLMQRRGALIDQLTAVEIELFKVAEFTPLTKPIIVEDHYEKAK
jgi:hypothetical protein